ncbi:glycosyltransferase [Vibrio breoganii]|uniref:glycosyltransferase n=1 Tax=Vibrio breoganii TaxID=553239 RepID=UPI000C852204|nr:glycosyltransferase [Vibrio breoganii]PMF71301.1 hypothetical protein BCV08_18130 [Vibrio breoganii]
MIKIAYIISKSEVGGAQTWVRDQTIAFEGELEQYLVTNKKGWLTENARVGKYVTLRMLDSRFSIVNFIQFLVFLFENGIDVVVASSANAGVYARLASLFYKCRVIYVSHGWSCIYQETSYKFFYQYIEKLLSNLTYKIICVSENDRRKAIDIIGIDEDKLVTVRNSVLGKKIKLGLDLQSPMKILFLSRMAKPKRPDLIIQAVRSLPFVTLDLVGDGPLKTINESAPNVNFLGKIDDFNEFLDYDLFALISDSEGMPMSALEAAASGLPLLLSNVGGCGELIKKNGVLVENNVDEIVSAIEAIYVNYAEYKTNALCIASEHNLDKNKHKYHSLYSAN